MNIRNENTEELHYKIKIYGIVQGVGFRPFVYKKAKDFQISGWAQNVGGAVVIDCAGIRNNVKQFISDILKEPPCLAKIEKVKCTFIKNGMTLDAETGSSFII